MLYNRRDATKNDEGRMHDPRVVAALPVIMTADTKSRSKFMYDLNCVTDFSAHTASIFVSF